MIIYIILTMYSSAYELYSKLINKPSLFTIRNFKYYTTVKEARRWKNRFRYDVCCNGSLRLIMAISRYVDIPDSMVKIWARSGNLIVIKWWMYYHPSDIQLICNVLKIAAQSGHANIVCWLTNFDIPKNAVANALNTMYFIGDKYKVVRYLAHSKIPIIANILSGYDIFTWTMYEYACKKGDFKTIKWLAKDGLFIADNFDKFMYPLFKKYNKDIIDWLQKNATNVPPKYKVVMNVYKMACKDGALDVAKNILDENLMIKEDAMSYACVTGGTQVVDYILSNYTFTEETLRTAMILAVHHKQCEIIQTMLQHNISPDVKRAGLDIATQQQTRFRPSSEYYKMIRLLE